MISAERGTVKTKGSENELLTDFVTIVLSVKSDLSNRHENEIEADERLIDTFFNAIKYSHRKDKTK